MMNSLSLLESPIRPKAKGEISSAGGHLVFASDVSIFQLRMLGAMKEAKALDISGDNKITLNELRRLYDPSVLLAAEAR